MAKNSFKCFVSLAFSGLIVGGCSLGPSYQAPEASSLLAEDWQTDTTPLSFQSTDVDAATQWWETFQDPTLSTLIETAFSQNLTIAQAAERIVEAQARRGIVRSDRGPNINANAAYAGAGYGTESVAPVKPPTTSQFNLFSLGALASWEIDPWGRTQKRVDAADADIQASREALHAVALSTAAEVALAYFDARTLSLRIASLDQRIALQEKTHSLARVRLEAGTAAELEVSEAERLLQSTRSQRPLLSSALQQAENRLAVLTGKRPQATTLLAPGSLPSPPQLLGIGLPADLLIRRPDIRQAERAYAAAYARMQSAKADRLPRLSLTGSLKLQTDTLDNLLDPDAYIYSFGPALSAPLFASGRIQNSIQARQSQVEQARLALESALLQAIAEVENTLDSIQHSQTRITSLEAALNAAQASARNARDLYEAGTYDLLRATQAEEILVATEDSTLVARQTELSQIVQLYRTLGGGWQSSESQKPNAPDATHSLTTLKPETANVSNP